MTVETVRDRAPNNVAVWWHLAACRGVNPVLFYDEHPAAVDSAKRVCADCAVRRACLAHAVETGEEYGVWGGLTAGERLGRAAPGGPGRPRRITDDELRALFAGADPELPALEQILAAVPVSPATAYRTIDRALRLGLVERRGRTVYPIGR